ncbi:MAG: Monooxygenase, flavin-binding family, partial [uncultured Actinomycetospora sp.]
GTREYRAPRRGHRRRGPVRDRHRLSPRARAARPPLRGARGPRRPGRHVEPVPVPGHPLGLRHAHPGLPLPPLEQRHRAGRRPVDPRVRPRDRAGVRGRREDPLRPPPDPRVVGTRRPALDPRDPGSGDADLLVPAHVLGLLPLRPGLHPGPARPRPLRRHGRAPAALGPRAGLRRPARRRHRQRRDRRDAGARDAGGGRGRRPRDDATALAELRALDRAHRRRRADALAVPPARRGRPAHPRQEHRADHRALPGQPAFPALRARAAAQGDAVRAARGLRRRHPLQPELRPVGPADVHGSRRRPVPVDPARPGGHRHRPRRDVHRDRHPAAVGPRARGRRRRHRHGPEPADVRRRRGGRRRRARAPARHHGLQGHDALRRPEPRVHDRLHQRLLDAQGRPRRRVRREAAAAPAEERPRRRRAGARPGGRGGAVPRLRRGLRPALDRRPAQTGDPGAVAARDELRDRRGGAATRPGRRRRDALRPRGHARPRGPARRGL